MAMRVDGKTAILTGAGSGITFCFAKLLLSKGCNVVIADLTLRPESEALVAQHPLTSPGAKAVFQKTDVTDWTQLDKMFEVATERFGGIDIVCPGAGVYEPVSRMSSPNSQAKRDKCSLGQISGKPQERLSQKTKPPYLVMQPSISTSRIQSV
jgi:NAD(P)-dependent dehydrogenase (short-subunit alcohol dehydrogenase family)